MDEKTIKEALQKGERVTLECKRAMAEVPKSVWATYSAFANTIGGLILLGVDENLQEKDISKQFQIIGVDELSKIITDFWNTINSTAPKRFSSTESFAPRSRSTTPSFSFAPSYGRNRPKRQISPNGSVMSLA